MASRPSPLPQAKKYVGKLGGVVSHYIMRYINRYILSKKQAVISGLYQMRYKNILFIIIYDAEELYKKFKKVNK